MDIKVTTQLVGETFASGDGPNEQYVFTAAQFLKNIGLEGADSLVNGISHFLAQVKQGSDPNQPIYVSSNDIKDTLDSVGIDSDSLIQAGFMSAANDATYFLVTGGKDPNQARCQDSSVDMTQPTRVDHGRNVGSQILIPLGTLK